MLTVKSLAGLDQALAECQANLQQLEQRQQTTRDEQMAAARARLAGLRAHLPSILGSDVAFAAHAADLPHPQAETAKSQWNITSQARTFGELVREIDQLAKKFHASQEPQTVCAMRPLFAQLESLPFKDAIVAFKAEIDVQMTPAREVATSELKRHLGEWPSKAPQTIEFIAALERLLCLEPFDRPTLAAFDVLAEPIDLRLKFNFESGQKTQRYDKPEWLFYFLCKTLDSHTQWLKSTIQPLCPSGRFALDELISSLMPSIERVCGSYLANSLSDHELLSAFLQESFKFDSDLRDKYYYGPNCMNWPGLTTYLLLHNDGATIEWLDYEKTNANATFDALVEASNAWDVDYDSTDTSVTSRATVLTLGVCSLFDNITELYTPLQDWKMQLRFFNLQISLVDQFLAILKQHKNHPQADLDDYGKVLGSVGYFIDFLQHRNMHLIFIELRQSLSTPNGLLDEIVANLDKFRRSCLEETNAMIAKALKRLFKGYPTFSAEPLERRLTVFKAICNPVDFASIVFSLSDSLARYFWTNVVHAGSFSAGQAAALSNDLDSIWTSLGLAHTSEYQRLSAAARFLETGETDGLGADEVSALQRRRNK